MGLIVSAASCACSHFSSPTSKQGQIIQPDLPLRRDLLQGLLLSHPLASEPRAALELLQAALNIGSFGRQTRSAREPVASREVDQVKPEGNRR